MKLRNLLDVCRHSTEYMLLICDKSLNEICVHPWNCPYTYYNRDVLSVRPFGDDTLFVVINEDVKRR